MPTITPPLSLVCRTKSSFLFSTLQICPLRGSKNLPYLAEIWLGPFGVFFLFRSPSIPPLFSTLPLFPWTTSFFEYIETWSLFPQPAQPSMCCLAFLLFSLYPPTFFKSNIIPMSIGPFVPRRPPALFCFFKLDFPLSFSFRQHFLQCTSPPPKAPPHSSRYLPTIPPFFLIPLPCVLTSSLSICFKMA